MDRLKVNIAKNTKCLHLALGTTLLNFMFLSNLALAAPAASGEMDAYIAQIRGESIAALDKADNLADGIKIKGLASISAAKNNAGNTAGGGGVKLPTVSFKPVNIPGYGSQVSALGGSAQPINTGSDPVKAPKNPFAGMSLQDLQALIQFILGQYEQIKATNNQQQR